MGVKKVLKKLAWPFAELFKGLKKLFGNKAFQKLLAIAVEIVAQVETEMPAATGPEKRARAFDLIVAELQKLDFGPIANSLINLAIELAYNRMKRRI